MTNKYTEDAQSQTVQPTLSAWMILVSLFVYLLYKSPDLSKYVHS